MLIKIRPPYKVRMHQDQARTQAHDTYGTITQQLLSWILNRVKEVIGWLSQNLWVLITGVEVSIYTYFMTKTRRR